MSNISMKQALLGIIIANLIICLPGLSAADENSGTVPASKWIDREVYSKTGNQFGEIDDLVIRRSGRVKKVTIEVGGLLGIGVKLVAVSLTELQNLMLKEDGKIVLNTTEEQMNNKPEFDYYRRGLRPDYYFRPMFFPRQGYRSFPPPYSHYTPYGPDSSEHRTGPVPDQAPYDWIFSPSRFLASTVIHRRVINESGAYLGTVTDLLIDPREARIKKIILLAEDIRADDPQVAIPYEPPGFTEYGIVVDFSRKEIRNLPGFPSED